MKIPFLSLGLVLAGCLDPRAQVAAQSLAGSYWLELRDNTLLLKSANDSKPVTKSVALPSSTLLDYRQQVAVLADGRRVLLHEGDVVSLNGDITPAKLATPALVAVAPVAGPATPAPTAALR